MSFAVVWNIAATNAIDAAFNAGSSADKRLIADTVERVNDRLGTNALSIGESREVGLVRVLSDPPLTVHYRIEERLRIVRVFRACVYRKTS